MDTKLLQILKRNADQAANLIGEMLEDRDLNERHVNALHNVIKHLLIIRGRMQFELERRLEGADSYTAEHENAAWDEILYPPGHPRHDTRKERGLNG